MPILEICVDSYESAIIAANAGANRLELCEDLSVGGLTPGEGLVSTVKKAVSIPVYVLIRPRPGNFQYSVLEIEQMIISIIVMKKIGVDGLVFGALTSENEVDIDVCQRLLGASANLPVTFHRAFDLIDNKGKALEDIIKLKFQRILTSGGQSAAADNMQTLKNLKLQANSRILIMPGGDIDDKNILQILHETQVDEFHSSGRVKDPNSSKKSDLCSAEVVRKMRQALDEPWLWKPS